MREEYKLYSYFLDCGSQGELDGLFLAKEDEVKNLIGKELYFGEVLGKHSEVSSKFKEEDVELLSEDQDKIDWLVELLGTGSICGINPLDYKY